MITSIFILARICIFALVALFLGVLISPPANAAWGFRTHIQETVTVCEGQPEVCTTTESDNKYRKGDIQAIEKTKTAKVRSETRLKILDLEAEIARAQGPACGELPTTQTPAVIVQAYAECIGDTALVTMAKMIPELVAQARDGSTDPVTRETISDNKLAAKISGDETQVKVANRQLAGTVLGLGLTYYLADRGGSGSPVNRSATETLSTCRTPAELTLCWPAAETRAEPLRLTARHSRDKLVFLATTGKASNLTRLALASRWPDSRSLMQLPERKTQIPANKREPA